MAYLIVDNQNNLYKVAENEEAKNNLNCTFPPYTTIDISDDDFLKITQGLVEVNISDGVATLTDLSAEWTIPDEDTLKIRHNEIKETLDSFLRANPSHNMYTEYKNYFDYLSTFDYSSVSYPISKTWEYYCEQNSIPYFHALQIP